MSALVWTMAGLGALAGGAWMARPFLMRTRMEMQEADAAISIYRDQTDEVRRDLDAGLIDRAAFDEAREEIEERAHWAAKSISNDVSVTRRTPAVAAGLAAVVMAGSLGAYGWLGQPSVPDQPLEARRMEALVDRANGGDMASRIQILIDKTKENPTSFDDWWMLGRAQASLGNHGEAAEALRRAAELSDDAPAVLSAYGEQLTMANGNKVPTAARVVFEQVLQKQPDPRARYYVALAKAQSQDFLGALTDWASLARESEPEAPWMALVRRDIVNMARFTKKDVLAYLPDATPAEIAQAGGQPVTAESVADLEARLAGAPKDWKGWVQLAEMHARAGDADQAVAALTAGRNQFRAAPFVLGKFDEAAQELGLSGLKGPSDADIANAASMSAQDQADMIEGMVAGLAAKLEENPDHLQGWVMLIRSYRVLGQLPLAEDALAQAKARFKEDAEALAILERDTR